MVVVVDGDDERVLLDPMQIDPEGTTTLDSWQPSKEGDLVAYQLSTGGTEESVLRVLDVATGEVVDGPIDRARYSPVAWLPGGEAFFYVRRLAPELLPADEVQYHRRVWLHRLGTRRRAGRRGVRRRARPHQLLRRLGLAGRPLADRLGVRGHRAAHRRLDRGPVDQLARGAGLRRGGGRARRRDRCVGRPRRSPLRAHEPRRAARPPRGDRPDHPGRRALDDAARGGPDRGPRGRRVRRRRRRGPHADRAARVVAPARGLRGDGARPRVPASSSETVPLPGLGSISGLVTRPEGGQDIWFSYTDHTSPSSVHHLDAATRRTTLWAAPPGLVADLPDVVAQQIDVVSKDGTVVRAFVVALADALDATGVPTKPAPTILYGYGGFQISLDPAYSASTLAWVEAGGVYVVANLRGGGEEGEQWHRDGMRGNKQNVYDDFHAVGEHLVANGWTTPDAARLLGRLERRPAGRRRGHPAARPVRGGGLLGSPARHGPVPAVRARRHVDRGVRGRGRPDRARLAARVLAVPPRRSTAPTTRPPCSRCSRATRASTRCTRASSPRRCRRRRPATRRRVRSSLRRETGVGHGGRSLSRSIGLSVEQLQFAADRTGLWSRA